MALSKHWKNKYHYSYTNSYKEEGTLPNAFYEISIMLIPKPDKTLQENSKPLPPMNTETF